MAEISSFTKQVFAATSNLPEITLGNSDFPEVCRDGTLFVDKTEKIPLLLKFKKVFFSRPRRFGKTTLVSMLFELFMHGPEMFKGLAVYDTWPEKQCYPVISISLYDFSDPKIFEAQLCKSFGDALSDAGLPELKERAQGIVDIDDFFSKIRGDLISRRTVWLIDEVDYPLSANLDNRPAFDANAKVLRKFFAQLRKFRSVRFMLVTGILRYQNISLFSGQDIVNISMKPLFADLVGYTQAEVETNFAPYIARAAEMLGLSREDFLAKLKLQYDGFCFDSDTSVSLYCPWSINNFFHQIATDPYSVPKFADFWMNSSGASKALRSFLQARRVDFNFLDQVLSSEIQVSAGDFNDPSDFDQLTLPSIMVQSGYLTLKRIASEADDSSVVYACGVPNLEIKTAFVRVAYNISMVAHMGQREFDRIAVELRNSVVALDMAAMARALNALLVCVAYDARSIFIESDYRSFISWSLVATESASAVREETYNSHGRSDIELECKGKLLVIELKRLEAGAGQKACLSLAQKAQKQIVSHGYSHNLDALQQRPYKERNALVLVISDKDRQIVYWRLLSLDKVKLKQEPLLGEGWVEPLPLEESVESKATPSDEAGKKPKKAAQQVVARDEGLAASSGEGTPRKGEKEAGAAQVSERGASAETGSASSSAGGNRPQVLTKHKSKRQTATIATLIDITIEVAQSRATDSEHQVMFDLSALSATIKALAAKIQAQKEQYTSDDIKSLVEFYLDLAQSTATTQAKACDRDYLEQQVVALLTKLL